jgi:hypothetical protein
MNNNEILKRIILKSISEEYPNVKDVKIVSYDNEGKYYYTIFLGIKYDDLTNTDSTELKKRTRELFKYVYPHDTLHNVSFFNPEMSYY